MEKLQLMMPDYDRCLTNVTSSLLRSFGLDARYPSLEELDPFLEKPVRNVVLLLLDGMGSAIMARHLDRQGFFHSHRICDISSVFPPTTVAATTSLLSGLTPREHSWLGWDCYFKELDSNISVFENCLTGTKTLAHQRFTAWTFCPYDSIILRIQEAGFHAYYSASHEQPHPRGLDGVLSRVSRLCSLDQRKFIYAYWGEPDHTMHRKRCDSEEAHTLITEAEEQIREWSTGLEDTLLIILADHGHLNINGESIQSYPELTDCLVRLPSMDVRAVNFFVKPEKDARFHELFKESFSDSFRLFSHAEAKELLGRGEPHPEFDGMLGDYLAVATGRKAIFPNEEKRQKYVSHHAGLTRDEMEIPLIIVDRR